MLDFMLTNPSQNGIEATAGDSGRCLTCRHFSAPDHGCLRNGTVTDAAGREPPMMYVYPAMRAQ
ncbi:conserved protein of unknown function [Rhodovastum atsumiense]|uniref:Uncharacterized protein n=1 Tax=Rhodovastum atsumiense TaxID=504468 RepID=A0A5M6J2J6_9PROT|nr:hypothetical protein [Rhodovastum atsumiense]KAA5613818.1 hypothetical protein F1189_03310 [Rhodovastum atsumiense]CAH2601919.1 conserved protein of unknown function [Rhodovastum atsumiense]